MAVVGFDDFSAPCSDLVLPPLFGGNILESELEQEVEFTDSGLHDEHGGGEEEEEEAALELQRETYRKKYHALQRRCKEIETVNEKLLNRLDYVGKVTRRLKRERRFLMKTLDSHGDGYRTAQLTILLEDESSHGTDPQSNANAQGGQPEGEDPRDPKGSQGSVSPPPGEGVSVERKRKRAKEEREPPQTSKRHPSPFYILGQDQIKQECSDEESSSRDVNEPLSQVWNPTSPEEKVGYSHYPSPAVYPEFD
ncbi:TCF3 fusion partner [Heptranchias perlo]|uniref:TCF3 fusion partner n=1 Tax=Heptranchias perlo TaxID=212740 RepID=UPI003559BCDB